MEEKARPFKREYLRQKPEYNSGDYYFSGNFYVTRGVVETLDEREIHAIHLEIKRLVESKGGQDYLQVFKQKRGKQKLFLIDNLSREMLNSGQYSNEHNYCTLMLAEEY